MKIGRNCLKQSLLGVFACLFVAGAAVSVFADCGPAVPICLPNILDPLTIPKYADPLVIPPAMPKVNTITVKGQMIDYYEISMRQFVEQILPAPLRKTTVWSYGAEGMPGTFNAPAFTIEAQVDRPVRVKWINGLVDLNGNYLPHLFAVDQTLHWANPPGPRDHMGMDQKPYTGPVPIVTHVHGAHVTEESDGYPEAWWLPAAKDIPSYVNFTTGTYYDQYKAMFEAQWGQTWEPGTAVYQYANDQRAATLWYHDHALGMTRLNVYAGPAGFFMLRGGPSDLPPGVLPGPAPQLGDAPGTKYYEIPIAIQDRIFNKDGSLFFPDNRAFFEGLLPDQLEIPFAPMINPLNGLVSDVAPIWNPEFFGNVMMVNGKTWPFLSVEPRRYRFRFLNGCNARFLILQLSRPGLNFWQIGTEGGFLPAPIQLNQLLVAPAERADVIVDFTGIPVGTEITILNLGPDEPFGGGIPAEDFEPSDPNTTGQVMKFKIVALTSTDTSTPPASLTLPPFTPLGNATATRQVSLNESESATVNVIVDANGNIVASNAPEAEPFGPTQALLGTLNPDGTGNPLTWMAPITEKPQLNATEIWEIYNFTMDAHPIHLHLVMFQVVDRTPIGETIGGPLTSPPESWEAGYKDTVIAYPGEITRLKAKFDIAGRYVWHCHIIDHEDNEMMRAYEVVSAPNVPAAPSNLAAEASAHPPLAINLTWMDNSDNETGFVIQKANNPNFADGITTIMVGADVTSYADTAVTFPRTYYYRVKATGALGDSDWSNTASVRLAQAASPSNLTATAAANPLTVLLGWKDNSSVEAGYEIQRAANSSFTGAVSFEVGANVTSDTDDTVQPATRYYYRVRSFNGTGSLAWSNTVTVTTPGGTSDVVIVDNGDPGTSSTGVWQVSGASNPYGTNSVWSYNGATYTWSFTPATTATYRVSMWWTALSSRYTAVPVAITNAGATANMTVNQTTNGGQWNVLGQYTFNAGTTYTVTIAAVPTNSPPSTSADAVKWEQL